ncbi:dehydrogenase [Streptococcus porcinus]|uniref:Dehydrogenase n=1 Tax=Streptococcus porcinus TaxID=1340 RepID=A0A4V6LZ83_STRPO|nr:dehydrogenase [Streptococcus porcinus]VTT44050.1 dehydrogenase [Streptococcus porcinus]VTT45429.1 dehydrogenase [Streptococcus porcinus]
MSRNHDCKNILIIGFGKIGKIKADKWLSRGYNVYVKDLKFSSMKLLNKNVNVLDDLSREYFTIEICTPTNDHLRVLKTIVKTYLYSYISIEKPLCNKLEDLEEMILLVESQPHLSKKVFANEQYFFSKIIEKLLQAECFSLDKTKEITIDFSKDRIKDNENGRFLDQEILGYGIELPHIIAVISYLGISLEKFKKGIFVNTIYIKDLEKHDYSIEISSCINQMVVKITSNLGSFAIREGKIKGGDVKTVRRVTIDDKIITFDPHPKLERYTSELVAGKTILQIHDDMMDTYISLLEENSIPEGCYIHNAVKLTKFLIELYSECEKIYL